MLFQCESEKNERMEVHSFYGLEVGLLLHHWPDARRRRKWVPLSEALTAPMRENQMAAIHSLASL
jgi:hypothetical protein